MLDYSDAPPRTAVPTSDYTVRVYAKGFGTISSDGIHGDDLYHVVLWPGLIQDPSVLKQYPEPLPAGSVSPTVSSGTDESAVPTTSQPVVG